MGARRARNEAVGCLVFVDSFVILEWAAYNAQTSLHKLNDSLENRRLRLLFSLTEAPQPYTLMF